MHQALLADHILPNHMMALLCMFDYVVQLLRRVEQKHINHLGVGDVLVFTDLLSDGRAELRGRDNVVEVVDLHDGGDRAACLLEEIEDAVPGLLQRGRVRRHLHCPHRERHRFESPAAPPPVPVAGGYYSASRAGLLVVQDFNI